MGNVHEAAQQARVGARVVYVDSDPVAVAHSRAILAGDAYADAVRAAQAHDPRVIVEANAAGLEIECSVLGPTAAPRASQPGEIVIHSETGWYDYEAKYTPGLSETSTRAEIPDRMREAMKKLARDAYRALGTEGFARVDFLVRGEQVFISEINTIPGFTPISLFPTMPAEAGLDFTAVCLRIIDLALERHEASSRRRLTTADLPR